ncbi:hypothetical protein [Streptomyces sp. NPDC006645]|uniref:hypothetical protein n=1 Tax=unclassified Streptomyces TaxID=2593676 RepID=UPI0033AE0228
MNPVISSVRPSFVQLSGTGALAGPARGGLTIEHLDAPSEHAVALASFCIASTDSALSTGARNAGGLTQ